MAMFLPLFAAGAAYYYYQKPEEMPSFQSANQTDEKSAPNQRHEQALNPLYRPEDSVNVLLQIAHVRWFLIEDRTRYLIAEGPMNVVAPPEIPDLPQPERLMFLFPRKRQAAFSVSSHYPATRVGIRYYIFPANNQFFGLSISDVVDTETILVFEHLLSEFTTFESPNDDVDGDQIAIAGHQTAHYVRTGAGMIATTIRHGATAVTSAIHSGKDLLKERIDETSPIEMNKETKDALMKANDVAGAAAKAGTTFFGRAMTATAVLGNEITDSLSNTRVGETFSRVNLRLRSVSEIPRVQAVTDVISSAFSGAETLRHEIQVAGQVLMLETTSATTELIEHRYGRDAGMALRCASEIVQNASELSVASSIPAHTIRKNLVSESRGVSNNRHTMHRVRYVVDDDSDDEFL